jgi:hypothetical protein
MRTKKFGSGAAFALRSTMSSSHVLAAAAYSWLLLLPSNRGAAHLTNFDRAQSCATMGTGGAWTGEKDSASRARLSTTGGRGTAAGAICSSPGAAELAGCTAEGGAEGAGACGGPWLHPTSTPCRCGATAGGGCAKPGH